MMPSQHPARVPLSSLLVSILGEPGNLILRGGAQVAVSPPAFTFLLLLILQSPLPSQARGRK